MHTVKIDESDKGLYVGLVMLHVVFVCVCVCVYLFFVCLFADILRVYRKIFQIYVDPYTVIL